MKIYIAGSSKEASTVRWYMKKLAKETSFKIAFDWTEEIINRETKGQFDHDLTDEEKGKFALLDLDAVIASKWFWLISPSVTSIGCYVELGAALALRSILGPLAEVRTLPIEMKPPNIIISGPCERNIFASLVPAECRFETHEKAFHYLLNSDKKRFGII
jgi:hypothetical protein